MSLSELQRFAKDIESNADLKNRVHGAGNIDARVAAARAAGYEFDKADFESSTGAMSDKDLDNVSGGGLISGWNRFANGFRT